MLETSSKTIDLPATKRFRRTMSRIILTRVCLSTLLGFLSIALAAEQKEKPKPPQEPETPYTLEVDVNLVNINAVVTSASGNYLVDLKKDNFKIYEDKVEQQITHFSPVDAPFDVALLLDTSFSAVNKLAQIQDEAIEFVKILDPDDEVMVISFDDEVHLETDFTRNKNAVERAIKMTRTGQSTQLYEAVYLALQEKLRKRRGRKAMVLFTDGVDTTSPTSSASETTEVAKEADVVIYPIYFDTSRDVERYSRSSSPFPTGRPPGAGPQLPIPQIPIDTRSPRQRDEDHRQINMQSEGGRSYLHTLAEVTGGTVYVADRMENLGAAFSKIAAELRSQYSLGYVSTNQKKDGKYRKVTVKVDLPGCTVKAKKGYYSNPKKNRK
jgi:Ca-activated chloride channel family protein